MRLASRGRFGMINLRRSVPTIRLAASRGHTRLNAAAPASSDATGTSLDGFGAEKIVVLKRGKSQFFSRGTLRKGAGSSVVFKGSIDRLIDQGGQDAAAVAKVLIVDHDLKPIAWGFHCAAGETMYRVRVLGQFNGNEERPDLLEELSAEGMRRFLSAAIDRAIDLRSRILLLPSQDTTCFRLINAEGDGLSGLVVDCMGDVLVAVSSAAWTERHADLICELLAAKTGACRVVWKRQANLLRLEGVEVPRESNPPDEVRVLEDGMAMVCNLQSQKTGFYCDQRENRRMLKGMARGKTVLDLCCYNGGFAIAAALGGATRVVGVDSSAPAVAAAARNAQENAVPSSTLRFVEDDVSKFMARAIDAGDAYDIVVLDPPKLCPNAGLHDKSLRKYERLNANAMQLVAAGGALLTCTCSGAITQGGKFETMLHRAAARAGREVRVLSLGGAGPDHVVASHHKEGRYLTVALCQVL